MVRVNVLFIDSIIPEVLHDMTLVVKIVVCVSLGVGVSSVVGASFVWFMKKNAKKKRKPFKVYILTAFANKSVLLIFLYIAYLYLYLFNSIFRFALRFPILSHFK
jgi:ABC-type nickel/cobalt efflux system permease component RcnA